MIYVLRKKNGKEFKTSNKVKVFVYMILLGYELKNEYNPDV